MTDLKRELEAPKVNGQFRNANKIKKIIAITLVTLITIASGALFISYQKYSSLLAPVSSDKVADIIVEVPKGSSTTAAANLLAEKELIQSPFIFKLYFKLKGLDGKLKPGEYALNSNMSLPEIADKLVEGKVLQYSFTIPEGYNTKQIVNLLENKGYIDKEKFTELVVKGEFSYDFLQGIPASEERLEGYLFPDTYKITKTTTEKQIINMMLDRFKQELPEDYGQKAKALGLTVHEAVTLASIIEREAVKDDERPKVAAVFLNRIKKGMKLESCATIQYALGEQKSRLLYSDLKIESPYNTYKYLGLPPGPIAAPGGPSLMAAVNPANVDYLFFVVSEGGEHAFSRTFAEHNKAKAKYVARFKTP